MWRFLVPLALIVPAIACVSPEEVERPQPLADEPPTAYGGPTGAVVPLETVQPDLPIWVAHVVPPRSHAEAIAEIERMEATLDRGASRPHELTHRLAREHLRIAVQELQERGPYRPHAEQAARLLRALCENSTFKTNLEHDLALLELGIAEHFVGNPTGWQDAMLDLIREHPTSEWIPYAYLFYADSRLAAEEPVDAIKIYQKLLAFDEPLVKAYASYGLGEAIRRLDPSDVERRREAYDDALELTENIGTDSGRSLRLATRLRIDELRSEPAGEADRDRRDQ